MAAGTNAQACDARDRNRTMLDLFSFRHQILSIYGFGSHSINTPFSS